MAGRDLLSRHMTLVHPMTASEGQDCALQQSPADVGQVDDTRALLSEAGPDADLRNAPDDLPVNNTDTRLYLTSGIVDESRAQDDNPSNCSSEAAIVLPQPSWFDTTASYDDFSSFIDNMTVPYVNGPALFDMYQPALQFSPSPLFSISKHTSSYAQAEAGNVLHNTTPVDPISSHLFDQLSSAFPSFETLSSQAGKAAWEPWRISKADWDHILTEMMAFGPSLVRDFLLPSRHTLSRYIATYVTGCHRHLPFLHIPSFSATKWPVALVLAMAAIGAQYSFDRIKAVELFRIAKDIALRQLRERKSNVRAASTFAENRSLASTYEFSTPRPRSESRYNHCCDSLSLAQTLLSLLVMATWANSEAIFDEAPELRGLLTSLIRDENLLAPQAMDETTWLSWVQCEGVRRTVSIAFCFFNLHTLVYNTPATLLSSELCIRLPAQEALWEARDQDSWQEASKQSHEPYFQDCLALLFTKDFELQCKPYSTLGGYVLILALVQHIFLVREMNKFRPGSHQHPSCADVTDVELALKNWQLGWNKDPSSSLEPGNPKGPLSFNATALLRMAYIRLNVDIGPSTNLSCRDPDRIAQSLLQSPDLTRSHKMTRVVLYSAHALSIPLKIGINVVAHNQSFAWPPGHALCALACAVVVSKWLMVVQAFKSHDPLNQDETRVLRYIADMLDEADPQSGFAQSTESEHSETVLCVGVVKTWARIMTDQAVWDIVRLVGKSLERYGQLLAQQSSV